MWTLISFSPKGAVVRVDNFGSYETACGHMATTYLQNKAREAMATRWQLYAPWSRLPVKL